MEHVCEYRDNAGVVREILVAPHETEASLQAHCVATCGNRVEILRWFTRAAK